MIVDIAKQFWSLLQLYHRMPLEKREEFKRGMLTALLNKTDYEPCKRRLAQIIITRP